MNSDPTGPGRTRALLLLGTIFVMGMACGATLLYIGQRTAPGRENGPPQGPPRDALMRLTHDLDLDEEQRQRIGEILRASRENVRSVLDATRDEIREVLSAEQQELFESLHPPGHPPPGQRPRGGRPPRDRGRRPPPPPRP